MAPAGPVESQIPGMCLDDSGNRTASGTSAVLWKCNGTTAEAWTLEADGTIRIHGKCLDIYRDKGANGTPVVLESCDESKGGERAFYGPSPFGGTLMNIWNGHNLAVTKHTASNGTPVVSYNCGVWLGCTWRVR